MSYRTSIKEIRSGWENKICVSYGGMQNLLQYRTPLAYTCGVYGWNFDLYNVNGVAVCTGYRGMPGRKPDYDLMRDYEKAAERVNDASYTWETKKEMVNMLLDEFVRLAIGQKVETRYYDTLDFTE